MPGISLGDSSLAPPASADLTTLCIPLATAAAAAAITLTGAARMRRLRFRHQIEAIRDGGIDAVLDGRLRNQSPVAEYLAALDVLACYARWAMLVAVAGVLPGLLADDDPPELPDVYRDVTAGEQYIIGEIQARVRAAIRSYLVWPLVPESGSHVLYTRHAAPGQRP